MTMCALNNRGISAAILGNPDINAHLKLARKFGGVPNLIFDPDDALHHPATLLALFGFCQDHKIGLEFDGGTRRIVACLPAALHRSVGMKKSEAWAFVKKKFPGGTFLCNRKRRR